MPIKMDEDQIKTEAENKFASIQCELNFPDFSQLCPANQVMIFNTLRFSVKEHFSIGIKDNDKVDKIVQDVLWPQVDCVSKPLTPLSVGLSHPCSGQ